MILRLVLWLIITLLTAGCASFATIGWNDLPDGSRLKFVKAQSDTLVGTDTNLSIVVHCPSEAAIQQGGKCTKFSEFGGSSPSFLKTIFHGAAAGAAMGAGLALSGDEITSGFDVSAEGGSATAGASASSRANATAAANAQSISRQQRPQHPHFNHPQPPHGHGRDY